MIYYCTDIKRKKQIHMLENRVLRTILTPEKEAKVCYSKLQNQKLHNLYFSPNNITPVN
jgi:hypothetical protein